MRRLGQSVRCMSTESEARIKPIIALFIPSLAGGGAEKMTLHLAGELVRMGYEVDLLLVSKQGDYSEMIPVGVRAIELGPRRLLSCILPLAAYLNKRKPMALLSALTLANCVAIVSRALACSSVRLLISERNHLTTVTKSTERFSLRFLPLVVGFLYPLADVVVGISQGVVEDLRTIAPKIKDEKLHVIYNPVITDDQILSPRSERAPHPWLSDGSYPVILAAGRLVPQKDFKTLLTAFSLLRAHRAARLVILGEGPQREELLTMAHSLGVSDDLLMPGFVSNTQDWYSRADIFVMSSAWEGLGNVLVEALFFGLPVVSTDCCSGPSEILDNGKYGMLVPVGDYENLATAISSTIESPIESSILKNRAMDFHVSRATKRYLRFVMNPQ